MPRFGKVTFFFMAKAVTFNLVSNKEIASYRQRTKVLLIRAVMRKTILITGLLLGTLVSVHSANTETPPSVQARKIFDKLLHADLYFSYCKVKC